MDASAQHALIALRDGDDVEIRPQPDNPVDRLAIYLCSAEVPIGWVPQLLCPAVHDTLAEGPVIGRVLKVNGPEVPPRMRLLVELNGSVPRAWDPSTTRSGRRSLTEALMPDAIQCSGSTTSGH